MLLLYHSHKHISYPIRTIARSAILAERTKKTEILSAIPRNSQEDLMTQVAKSRCI
ncbi:hypothetical protein [Wolbachia endosymbiont (group A) of Nomada hirtipes]|uniref:hypothetical protein n=1 Tax=Wolbachia endosymbiont (group A) of Nomada hirtipes TaxID=3066208 RepID=UPI0030CB59B5